MADLIILGICGWFLATAVQYPSYAHVVPGVVGIIAVGAALIQVLGNVFPRLRNITHGPASELAEPDHRRADPGEGIRKRRELMIVAWSVAFLVGIILLGYVVAVPAFFFAYFVVNRPRRWILAVVSATVMWGVTWGVFDHLLGLSLPGGLLVR